ncbi:hypothetical protein [Burkholderia ubonensis]|nr:hypothetical protein [Burkholderia ubonensis]
MKWDKPRIRGANGWWWVYVFGAGCVGGGATPAEAWENFRRYRDSLFA